MSSVKVIIILGLIILSLVLALGGGPDHDRTGFRYWHNPGAFATYIMTGSTGRFLAFWSTLTTAVFAYLGTELVGVTVGECQNPRRIIPRAIKLTFYRILLFYVVLVFLLGMIVPYNSKQLKQANSAKTSATASPFVVAIQISGIKFLPAIFNACVLIFVFSAANSGALKSHAFRDITNFEPVQTCTSLPARSSASPRLGTHPESSRAPTTEACQFTPSASPRSSACSPSSTSRPVPPPSSATLSISSPSSAC